MIHIHSMVWDAHISAHINEEGYEISLPQWSGRQSDVSQIDALIRFLQTVMSAATPADWLAPKDEPQPPVSSATVQAVSEIIAEEQAQMSYEAEMSDLFWQVNNALAPDTPDKEKLMADFEAKQIADHAELVAQEKAGWLTPATDEELAGQHSDSRDLEDFFDEDDDEDYYPY